MSDIDDLWTKISYLPKSEATKIMSKEILNLILKALPPEQDIRPEITQWLISEDYSKGYNKALGHAEKAIRKVLG